MSKATIPVQTITTSGGQYISLAHLTTWLQVNASLQTNPAKKEVFNNIIASLQKL